MATYLYVSLYFFFFKGWLLMIVETFLEVKTMDNLRSWCPFFQRAFHRPVLQVEGDEFVKRKSIVGGGLDVFWITALCWRHVELWAIPQFWAIISTKRVDKERHPAGSGAMSCVPCSWPSSSVSGNAQPSSVVLRPPFGWHSKPNGNHFLTDVGLMMSHVFFFWGVMFAQKYGLKKRKKLRHFAIDIFQIWSSIPKQNSVAEAALLGISFPFLSKAAIPVVSYACKDWEFWWTKRPEKRVGVVLGRRSWYT